MYASPADEVVLVFVHQHLPGSSAMPMAASNMTDDVSFASLAFSVDKCLDMFCWRGDFSVHKALNYTALEDLTQVLRRSSSTTRNRPVPQTQTYDDSIKYLA